MLDLGEPPPAGGLTLRRSHLVFLQLGHFADMLLPQHQLETDPPCSAGQFETADLN
jgi:hypothetical protein